MLNLLVQKELLIQMNLSSIFIAENEKGKLPRQIFEEYGFDIEIIGIERVQSSSNRWRTAYKRIGSIGT